MAGRGPAPKDPSERVRRNKTEPETVVQADGELHGPDLPDETFDWPDATRLWWETWRRSAQAKLFTETDWSFLLDTAILHMRFWDGEVAVAGELRLRAAKFGATPEDRARLKIAVGEPKAAEKKPAQKPRQKARRSAILSLVTDAEEAGA